MREKESLTKLTITNDKIEQNKTCNQNVNTFFAFVLIPKYPEIKTNKETPVLKTVLIASNSRRIPIDGLMKRNAQLCMAIIPNMQINRINSKLELLIQNDILTSNDLPEKNRPFICDETTVYMIKIVPLLTANFLYRLSNSSI